MRKLSSHYYLRPDATLGKRPIIELDKAGVITAIRELGDDFKEEPGLEYFPGIIIPAFVASLSKGGSHELKRQAVVNGVLRIKEGVSTLDKADYRCAWTTIQKQLSLKNQADALLANLNKHTTIAAQLLGESTWGRLQEGANPGLLVLQYIDLRSFTLTEKSSFKIIQK